MENSCLIIDNSKVRDKVFILILKSNLQERLKVSFTWGTRTRLGGYFCSCYFISGLQRIFSGVSKTTFGFNDSLIGNIELRKAIKLMVMVYYSERTHLNQQLENRHREKSRKQAWATNCLSSEVMQTALNSSTNDVWWLLGVLQPGKLLQALVPAFLL